MEPEELTVVVRVLQESFSGLSRDQVRLEELSTFLEQRVRTLEHRLAELGAKDEGAEAPQERLVKVHKSADTKGVGPIDDEGESGVDGEIKASDLDNQSQDRALVSSSWDACLLLGTPALGLWGSACIIMNILLNMSIQISFCALVFANFLTTEFSEEDIGGLKAWRLRVAHDDRFKSALGMSLASRVCGLDPSLEVSNEQAGMVDLIRSYIPSLDPGLSTDVVLSKDWMKYHFDGRIMCLVAVSCWVLTVSKEIGSIFDLVGAVLETPSGHHLGVQVASSGEGVEILSIGVGAKVSMMCVSAVRLGIAVVLLVMGCFYLAYTSSMQDLLLNAVALEFIMTVDELVFEAISPRRVRQVIGCLAPLKLPPWPRRWRAVDLKTLGLSVLLFGMLIQLWNGSLAEHIGNLVRAHDNLCSGDVDFTVAPDSLNMLHMMPSRPFSPIEDFTNKMSVQDRAVQELVDRTHKDNYKYTLLPSTYGHARLEDVRSASLQSLVTGLYSIRGFFGCHDAVDLTVQQNLSISEEHLRAMWKEFIKMRGIWLFYLRDYTQTYGTACKDFVHFCHVPAVISLCPQTCMCESFMGGPSGDPTTTGCPAICRMGPQAMEKSMVSCTDAQLGNQSDPKWRTLTSWGKQLGGRYSHWLNNQSCNGLLNIFGGTWLCTSPNWLRSTPGRTSEWASDLYTLKLFTFLCPETCNCGGRGSLASQHLKPPAATCPDSCICPWSYPALPGTNVSTCNVPYYYGGYTLKPVQTSGECCYLMQENSRLSSRTLAGHTDTVPLRTWRQNACHPCRHSCLDQLIQLQVVQNPDWTYFSAYFLLTTGSSTVVGMTPSVMCNFSP